MASAEKYYFYSTAYTLMTSVICIDDTIDSDGDGIVDCEDAFPTDFYNGSDDWDYGKLNIGKDDKDPEINCHKISDKGNPVSIYTGNKTESEQDIAINSAFAGGFDFIRFYNSQSEEITPMGYGWTHNYLIRLEAQPYTEPDTELLVITDETGFGRYFRHDLITAEITALFEERTRLAEQNGNYIWRRADGTVFIFDAAGFKLHHIQDRIGNRLSIAYKPNDSHLIDTVSDETSGRLLKFSYTDGFLNSIRLFLGNVDAGIQVSYSHDEHGNLTSALYADGSGYVYEYKDIHSNPIAPFINNLTRKTDAAGHLLSIWAYDDQDRCYFNETGDGRSMSLDFDTVADAVVVTDAYGALKTYHLTTIQGRKRIAEVRGNSGCTDCIDEPVRWQYDEHLNVVEMEYASGRIDQFGDFDGRGNPAVIIRAKGTDDEKVIEYTWHPVMDRPLTRTEQSVLGPGYKTTTWDYDGDGNGIANENPGFLIHRIIDEGYTTDASGRIIPAQSASSFSYDDRGRLLSMDGPLNGAADTVTFAYDPLTGDLLSITEPVAGTAVFGEYDATGRAGQVTDSNTNSVSYDYDGRGRLRSMIRAWDGGVTSFSYNLSGDIDNLTLPNGGTITYEYDDVYGRLKRITDPKGNVIAFDHDDQGNVIETGYFEPSKINTFRQRFDYQHPDRPGKLWKLINADDSFFEYGYDVVGNLSRITDPSGKMTTYGYDLLNRMTSAVRPGSVVTGYNYDGQNNLVSVTDPESRSTDYTVDDFGRTVKIVSPDSGTTLYAYDAAGNLVSKTDANDITIIFAYDSKYRLTAVHYPDPSQNVTFTYDQGKNGRGRLTGMIDFSGNYSYGWDEAGNMVSEQKTIDGIVYTTGYAYDEAGYLMQMTYPDGLVITWQRDTSGNVTEVTASRNGFRGKQPGGHWRFSPGKSNKTIFLPSKAQGLKKRFPLSAGAVILADNIDYIPFGPIKSMTLGNGISADYLFDRQYRMSANLAIGVQELGYGYDPVGNVIQISNTLEPANDMAFGYDDLYRLADAEGVFGVIGFGYDGTGNRLWRTENGVAENFEYFLGTNRLERIINAEMVDITTDAAGNTTGYGNKTLYYDQANRLEQVRQNDVISNGWRGRGAQFSKRAGEARKKDIILGSYIYSADGRRIKKVVGGSATIFHYDSEGRLIGESNEQGKLTRLYVYLNGAPLALITVDSSGENIYYYHNDHLGTPLKMTDAGGTIVWAADYKPFGEAGITVNTVENNLRFAGQYYDVETGLHYNYHRYYDPRTGRYLTPDPIGLAGGINPYVYVENNPVNITDSSGLSPYFGNNNDGGWDEGCDQFTLPKFHLTPFDFTELALMAVFPKVMVPVMIGEGVAKVAKALKSIPETKALTSPWPPNRGFFGKPRKETLQPGTTIDRYGYEGGSFVSPEGVPFKNRALHPTSASKPYNKYEVVKPVEVDAGPVAPWFGEPGGGMQYELPSSVSDLIEQRILKRLP